MKNKVLVVGLGNDVPHLRSTRHNAGRMLLEHWAHSLALSPTTKNFGYLVKTPTNIAFDFLWLKGFMNESGQTLKKALTELSEKPSQIIVCFDNAHQKPNTVQFFPDLGPSSHNGLQNIRLQFPRSPIWGLGLGIGHNQPLKEWVLKPLKAFEFAALQANFSQTIKLLTDGWATATTLQTPTAQANQMKKHFAPATIAPEWLTVTGGQFGDEGKGKVVDFLAQRKQFQTICRFSGGPNAGHTVHVGNKKFTFSMIPVGALHADKTVVLGSGCLINFATLVKEKKQIDQLKLAGKLLISAKAHVIMPYHQAWDNHEENSKTVKIGTTRQGIGPCMADKVNRVGVTVGELLNPVTLRQKLALIIEQKNAIWTKVLGNSPLSADTMIDQVLSAFEQFRDCVVDVQPIGQKLIHQSVLFEGAQGTLLDIHFGHFPFVTSTPTTSFAAQLGLEHGGSPTNWHHLGVFKAYTTRVGTGPLLGKMDLNSQNKIAGLGHEFGTVTGRQRALAWFDAPSARYAIAANRYDSIALTCLDALTGLKKISIIEAYETNKQWNYTLSFTRPITDETKLKMITLPGWTESISDVRSFDELPTNCQAFVHRIEALLGRKTRLLSVGPKRSQMIVRE